MKLRIRWTIHLCTTTSLKMLRALSSRPDTPSMLMNSTSSPPCPDFFKDLHPVMFPFGFADPQPQHVLYAIHIIVQDNIDRAVFCLHLFSDSDINTVNKKKRVELFQWAVLPFFRSPDHSVRNCRDRFMGNTKPIDIFNSVGNVTLVHNTSISIHRYQFLLYRIVSLVIVPQKF